MQLLFLHLKLLDVDNVPTSFIYYFLLSLVSFKPMEKNLKVDRALGILILILIFSLMMRGTKRFPCPVEVPMP